MSGRGVQPLVTFELRFEGRKRELASDDLGHIQDLHGYGAGEGSGLRDALPWSPLVEITQLESLRAERAPWHSEFNRP